MSYQKIKLADLLTPVSKQIQPKDFGDKVYVGLEHLKSGDISLTDVGIASQVKSTKWEFQSGDILYGKLRPYLNKCAVANRNGICSTDILVLRANKDVDAKYIAYCLSGGDFVAYANATVSGMNLPRTTWSKFNDYEISVPVTTDGKPDIEVQRCVAEKLDKVIVQIEQGLSSVAKNNIQTNIFKQSILAATFSIDGLVNKKLFDIAEVNPRKDFGTLKSSDDVSFVPMDSVDDITGVITKERTKKLGAVSNGYTSFRNGDVLFAKITPCMENGKCAVARDLTNNVGFGSTEFYVIRPKSDILPEYLWAFLRQERVRNEAKTHFTGAAGHKRVPKDFMENLEIPVPMRDGKPDTQEQRRIVDELGNVSTMSEKLSNLLIEQERSFTYLRSSVLNQTFQMQT